MLGTLPNQSTRSYSQLSDFVQCGWMFYLKRVRKLKEAPAVWLPGGTAFHTTAEQFDLLTWQENNLTRYAGLVEQWQATFRNNFADELDKLREKNPDESTWRTAAKGKVKSRPNGEDVSWWQTAGQEMVAKYIAWRIETQDILKIHAVKGEAAIEVEVNTSLGGVNVRGFIDRVLEDCRTGVLLLGDQKSGARLVTDTGQIGQYSVQFEQQFDRPVTWGAYYSARRGQLGEIYNLASYTENSLGAKYRYLEEKVAAGDFQPNITPLCKSCGVRAFCKFQGGVEPTPEETA